MMDTGDRKEEPEMAYQATVYLMFFLSGLSALIYQVLWVRSFSLIFGGSHMAVTTVLSVFMGGLALGGYLGKHTDRSTRPLRLYGVLELGIAAASLFLVVLLKTYPTLYVAFARLVGDQFLVLTVGRVMFAVAALLLPTTLMGMTLPALAAFATRRGGALGKHLSWLYGINTLGAVAGALSVGFFLLRHWTVNAAYGIAIGISVLVGLVSLWLDRGTAAEPAREVVHPEPATLAGVAEGRANRGAGSSFARLVLWGIGISGFCALGYEVLWTRILSIVIGTTVYGYTLMLVSFLIGIAAGGASYQVIRPVLVRGRDGVDRSVGGFGLIQILIGVLALLTTYALRDLPNQALVIEGWLRRWTESASGPLDMANLGVALLYMVVPAFFMGLSFPLAADVVSEDEKEVGRSVGRTLTYNTVGAILGAAVSGYVLIYVFGIERSLQYLSLMNLGLGLVLCASLLRKPAVTWGAGFVAVSALVGLYMFPDIGRMWDLKYFAVFNHNARQVFTLEATKEDILDVSDVLYYAEGATSTVSVVRIEGSNQALNVNGRTVASSARQDQQCQYTLGHLPMLLHPDPRKVWVLGLGTGMTAGATVLHPEVETVTVVELEKHVLPAARTFGEWNHDVLENEKVQVVFNDGRNFLLTTDERYDVITADPIHPWSQGSAYLYTDEYYRLAAGRLRPGGIMCQWLPIYELSPDDLKSIVRTFGNSFRYVYLWLTDYDAELVGTNSPISLDVSAMQERMEASPEILSALGRVNMGSAASFLSYCVMGPEGTERYSEGAVLNTDNNLFLEFSAPESKGRFDLVATNIQSLVSTRESISNYMKGEGLASALGVEEDSFDRAVALYDRAHILRYQGKVGTQDYALAIKALDSWAPWHAPGQYLVEEYERYVSSIPRLVGSTRIQLLSSDDTIRDVTLSAVSVKISADMVRVLIVDNDAKKIFGHAYLDVEQGSSQEAVRRHALAMLRIVEDVYEEEKAGLRFPRAETTLEKIEAAIEEYQPGSS